MQTLRGRIPYSRQHSGMSVDYANVFASLEKGACPLRARQGGQLGEGSKFRLWCLLAHETLSRRCFL